MTLFVVGVIAGIIIAMGIGICYLAYVLKDGGMWGP